MSNSLDRFGDLFRRREASVALMILALCTVAAFANEFFLTARNLPNVGRQASVVAIAAPVARSTCNHAVALTAGLGTGVFFGLMRSYPNG